MAPKREDLLAELEILRKANTFNPVTSLRNHYKDTAHDDLTNEQLSADIHEFTSEWEQELDEFFGTKD